MGLLSGEFTQQDIAFDETKLYLVQQKECYPYPML
jgi:hypothetical protein